MATGNEQVAGTPQPSQLVQNAQAAHNELAATAALLGVGKGKLIRCLLGAVGLKTILAALAGGGGIGAILAGLDLEKIIACLFPPESEGGVDFK